MSMMQKILKEFSKKYVDSGKAAIYDEKVL